MAMQSLLWANIHLVILGSAVLLAAWILFVIGSRLLWSPLSRVPGPKVAAISHLFEIYYDIAAGGRLPWKIKELHARYGPVVRIGPNEVHVADQEYAIQHLNMRSNKPIGQQNRMGFGLATSETPDAPTHKMRYNALAPSFSRRSVADLEPLIVSKVEKVLERISEAKASRSQSGAPTPIDLRKLFLCMTTDTLTTVAFGFSFDLLDDPNLAPEWRAALDAGIRNIQLLKHFAVGRRLLRIPIVSSFLVRLKPGLAMNKLFEQQNKRIARQAMVDCGYAESGGEEEKTTLATREAKPASPGQTSQNTIFHHLLSSDLPDEEKSHDRLWQEASSLMAAGSETTANALSFIIFHLHKNPACLTKLKRELCDAIPEYASALPPLNQLENLRYLSAVINEGLRMAINVTGRFQRILPDGTEVHEFLLPRGTIVSVSTLVLHMDEKKFPEPNIWKPERFLETDGPSRKDLFAFSKGYRACLGMNLAFAELYLTLAAVIRRFDLQLFETVLEDVEPVLDGIVALTKPGSRGVRVTVD